MVIAEIILFAIGEMPKAMLCHATTMRLIFLTIFIIFAYPCLPVESSAKDVLGNAPEKTQELVNSKPPVETPSGTNPAEPANPGQNPVKPAEPGNPGKPDGVSNPSDPANTGNPPEQTPSGTKPADPANPGENPANPAEPGDKETQNTDKNIKDKGKPDNTNKNENGKDKKDKPG